MGFLKKVSCLLALCLAVIFVLSVTLVSIFRHVNPPTTPLMWIRWTDADHASSYPRRLDRWKTLDQISPHLKHAVLTAEDQKFYVHNGFDWSAIAGAFRQNLESERKIGASTISMQTAKNVFLWQKRNWFRKGLEAYFTFLIEWLWTKERILEVYLNVIEWGEGLFGSEAAAKFYFKHSAKNLSVVESSFLAAILPNPREWSKPAYRSLIESRQKKIIHSMINHKIPVRP